MRPLLTTWPQGANEYHSLPPLQFRVASTEEPAPYLQQPVFSSCTVPVIYYRWVLHRCSSGLAGEYRFSSWLVHAATCVPHTVEPSACVGI